MHWRRKWQPTPVFLHGESQGREPGGLRLWGLTESDTTAATQQQHEEQSTGKCEGPRCWLFSPPGVSFAAWAILFR